MTEDEMTKLLGHNWRETGQHHQQKLPQVRAAITRDHDAVCEAYGIKMEGSNDLLAYRITAPIAAGHFPAAADWSIKVEGTSVEAIRDRAIYRLETARNQIDAALTALKGQP